MQGGGGGAKLAGIVYDPELTLTLPLEESVGTAMNALAHCAEALYVKGRNQDTDALALEGARTLNEALPRVAAFLHERQHRTRPRSRSRVPGRSTSRFLGSPPSWTTAKPALDSLRAPTQPGTHSRWRDS